MYGHPALAMAINKRTTGDFIATKGNDNLTLSVETEDEKFEHEFTPE